MLSTIHFLFKPATNNQPNENHPEPANSSQTTSFTLDELYELRQEPKRCLVGLFGHVYDVRKFLPYHPGLEKSIRGLQGHDITDLFTEFDPNHRNLDEKKVLKLLKDHGCEELGTIRLSK
jgi:cytochrome b involved in lipid metabolism